MEKHKTGDTEEVSHRTGYIADANGSNRMANSCHQTSGQTAMQRASRVIGDEQTPGHCETDGCSKVPTKPLTTREQQEINEESYFHQDIESVSRYSRQQSMGSTEVLDSIFDYHSAHPSVDMDDVPFRLADSDTHSYGEVFATVAEENNNRETLCDKLQDNNCLADEGSVKVELESVRRDHVSNIVCNSVAVHQSRTSSATELDQTHHPVPVSRLPGPLRSRIQTRNGAIVSTNQSVNSSSVCNTAMTDIRNNRNKFIMK
jgi:hypothetical protein